MQKTVTLIFCLATAINAFTAITSRKVTSSLQMAEKSQSLPFLPQPPNLVGIPGSVGNFL
jgi:hypothetical protein